MEGLIPIIVTVASFLLGVYGGRKWFPKVYVVYYRMPEDGRVKTEDLYPKKEQDSAGS